MSAYKIEAAKSTGQALSFAAVRGDNRTQIVRFAVRRYDGGIDLSPLAWTIHVVNAEGNTDFSTPYGEVVVTDSQIKVDWLVRGVATAVVGKTQFSLKGTGQDDGGQILIWRSAPYILDVQDTPDAQESSEEQEEQLSELDRLIMYVDGELNNVIAAGEAARSAAEAAQNAADGINNIKVAANTLEAGSQATVEISDGAGEAKVITYGIPKGDPGEAGPQGPQGPAGGVDSVNGKTGEVLLEASDVGAMPSAGGTFTGQISAPGAEFTAPLNIASGGTGANSAAGARNNLSVPELRNSVVIVNNQKGIGTGVSAGQYWQLWNLQNGDAYPAALCPSSNGQQLLGHNSYRIKAVYANDYPCGTWNGNVIALSKGGLGRSFASETELKDYLKTLLGI